MAKQTEQWSSNFGFLMAIIASAVGLGSIWRFPYMVASNGGSAFILAYTLIMILVGIVGVSVEIAIGRHSQSDTLSSYTALAPRSKPLGYIAILTSFLLMTMYSVLGGWVLHYLYQAITFKLTTLPSDHFATFTHSYQPIFWQLLFIVFSALILQAGINKGIEKYSIWMNLFLLFMIIILVFRSVTLPGAMSGVIYLLKPDFTKLQDSSVWLMATGQAFFSMSLGGGVMITYGCYVNKKTNILRSSAIAGLTTIIVALLMGFAIFPAIFATGQNPSEGPGLLFEVLPIVFSKMYGGSIFAIFFFLATFIAALTSGISLIEPFSASFVQTQKISRTSGVWMISLFTFIISIPLALSFNKLAFIQLANFNIFDSLNFVIDKIFFPFNALVALILAGWFWPKRGVIQELSNNGQLSLPFSTLLWLLIKFIIPLLIILIVLMPWLEKMFK